MALFRNATEDLCRICTWNANGLSCRTAELEEFMCRYQIHIMLVSETKSQNSNNFHIKGYQMYHTPRPNASTGGTAIYIQNGIDHTALATSQTTNLESTTILVKINNIKVKVTSLYQSPSKPFISDDYKAIFSEDVPHIVGGDFNAKHSSWHSRNPNKRGRELHDFIVQHPQNIRIISQPSPTFYSHQGYRPDIIDFFLVNKIEHDIDAWSISELQSDHNP